jgi:hypothetical protein
MLKPKTNKHTLWIFSLITITCLCQACAKSALNYSWSDDSYKGPVKGMVLVIGVYKDPVAHKIYEDSFVAELQKAGVQAVPSYKYNIRTPQPSTKELQQVVKQADASTVLITHLLNEKSSSYQFPEKIYAYAGSMSWDEMSGYHSTVYAEVWGGNKSVDKTVDRMEAVMFDGKSGKHIWSARSKSVNLKKLLRNDDEQLESLFIKDLKSHHLL